MRGFKKKINVSFDYPKKINFWNKGHNLALNSWPLIIQPPRFINELHVALSSSYNNLLDHPPPKETLSMITMADYSELK